MFGDLYRFQSRQETRNPHILEIRCTLVAMTCKSKKDDCKGTKVDGDDGLGDPERTNAPVTWSRVGYWGPYIFAS
jgi:hypothetical protein